ncbi:hypothetical protein [Phytohabitans kaempferiae]|uniref:Major facilitator superfamily (MFS) profile domain-containing protein n=1 Tax=Phytohabitans kaempferiae TaxID=1620943 RepID=A0ABV6LYC1_9ACTN
MAGGLLLDATSAPVTFLVAGGAGAVVTLAVAARLPAVLRGRDQPGAAADLGGRDPAASAAPGGRDQPGAADLGGGEAAAELRGRDQAELRGRDQAEVGGRDQAGAAELRGVTWRWAPSRTKRRLPARSRTWRISQATALTSAFLHP